MRNKTIIIEKVENKIRKIIINLSRNEQIYMNSYLKLGNRNI